MKKLFTSILAFIMALSVWAEAPQTISYQAVVRNNVGRLLREKPVGVRITILSGSEDGQVVYSETRTTTTNNNGLLTFAIGDANGVTTYDFSKIAWADNTYFLRCEMDPDGGNTYTLSSTSQMNSVPYALYAKNIAPEALPSWAQSEEKPVYSYTEIQDAPSVPTKVSELQNDANYITLQQVPTVVVPTKVSELQNDANYLTEHQSLADYAKKSELPSTEGLLSAADAVATYQPKGEYLTEHQSLTEYAKKSDLPVVPTKVSDLTNDAGYITSADVPTKVSELTNDEGFITTSDLPSNVSELTNDANYITLADVPAIPTKVSAFENDANYLTEHQSLTDYAKKSELPSTEGLLSAADAAATYQPKGEYLTEHQSLADYAKKSELPAIPTKVSTFENDALYITKAEFDLVVESYNALLEKYAKQLDSLGNVINGFQRTVSVEKGALPGLFSVAADKQVKFSMGNLQYQASTDTWRFAEDQYDYVGDNNANIASDYDGWIDLFGWGTSGYHDSKDLCNKNYYPYSISTTIVDEEKNFCGYGPSTDMPDSDLVGYSSMYDWGVFNAISNGGNVVGEWRTLSQKEWEYLIMERDKASQLRGKAKVNETNGYVILCDDWTLPEGVLFASDATSYADNSYSTTQWKLMEESGAVFFPTAGVRSKSYAKVDLVNVRGLYWTSSSYNSGSAYSFTFNEVSNGVGINDFGARDFGYSVRLVHDN